MIPLPFHSEAKHDLFDIAKMLSLSGSSPRLVTGVPSETLEFSSKSRRFFNTWYRVDVLKLMQSTKQ
jgi:hypothetical protein